MIWNSDDFGHQLANQNNRTILQAHPPRTMTPTPRATVLLLLHTLLLLPSIPLPSPALALALAIGPPGRTGVRASWFDLAEAGGRDDLGLVAPPRSGHVAFRTADGRCRIFGGYAEEEEVEEGGDPIRRAVNDMWEWGGAVPGGGWRRVGGGEDGAEPGPRLAAAAAVADGAPHLFGGWDPQIPGTGGVILDTVHRLEPGTDRWDALAGPGSALPGGPSSRHVALSLPGGKGALVHDHRCAGHVLVFEGGRFRRQPTAGTAPSSRGLHAAAMAGEAALVFGGAAQGGEMSCEAFALDTASWTWTPIALADGAPRPSPRAAPCLCALSDGLVLLFGGAETGAGGTGLNPRGDVWALRFDAERGTGEWELLVDDGGGGTGDGAPPGSPPPRNAATMSEIELVEEAFPEGDPPAEGEQRRCFLLQGGWAPFRRTWSDCYVLAVSH